MGDNKKNTHSIGSALRDRGKKPDTDIGDIWLSRDIETREKKKRKRPNLAKYIAKPKDFLINFFSSINLRFLKKKYVGVSLAILIVVSAVIVTANKSNNDGLTEQLGVSTGLSQSAEGTQQEVTLVKDTEFKLLLPAGSTLEETDVARVSPPGNDPVYAYLAKLENAEIRISQQQIPESFKDSVATKVEEAASAFQASNVIQVDDTKIYHGFSDKNGGVQSLIFEKNGILVLIASPVRFSDTQWASYISSIK